MFKTNRFIAVVYFLTDLTVLVFAFLLFVFYFNNGVYTELQLIVLAVFMLIWCFVSIWRKLYYNNLYFNINKRLLSYAKIYFFIGSLTAFSNFVFPFPDQIRGELLVFIISFPVIGLIVNYLLLHFTHWYKQRKNAAKKILIAGVDDSVNNLKHFLSSSLYYGYSYEDLVISKKSKLNGLDNQIYSGGVTKNKHKKDISDYLSENHVDEIIVTLPIKTTKKIKTILAAADYYGTRVKFIPDYTRLFGNNCKTSHMGRYEVVNIRYMPLDKPIYSFLKRVFDVLFSLSVLVILMPFLFLVGAIIVIDSWGPVLYCPYRVGKGGKLFKCYKFRSMIVNDNPMGGMLSTAKNDPRISRIGKYLRKYNIDELPQFINVLLGDMSVVGPRPHRDFLNRQLQNSEDNYMIRHYFRPGITGWAQVNGWRGPTDTEEQKRQRTLHDLWYLEHWSLWLDVKIVFKTLFSKKAFVQAY
jgi:Undecaprenyl-phosphate glucose phosphotransferase